MRAFENANYDFWGARRTGFLISGAAILLSIVAMIWPGLEAGVDFRGGTELVFITETPVSLPGARDALRPVLGEETEIKTYGSPREILVRTPLSGDTEQIIEQARTALVAAFPEARPQVGSGYSVSPRFSEDLKRGAIWSVFGCLLVILLYVLARYDWRYGLGAVATLAHDVIVILGIFAVLHAFSPMSFTITQAIIAALLTTVGYSVNDTVVIYDRIRETQALYRAEPFHVTANRAVNQTLSRTIMTGVTTLVVLMVLLLLGGEELRSFSLALVLGIVIGTYSSIFVATPLVIWLRDRYPVGRRAVARA